MIKRILSLRVLAGALVASVVAIVVAHASTFGGLTLNSRAKADMVFVPAGDAILGGDKFAQMPGPRNRFVDAFWIDRYEVTNFGYAKFTAATGRDAPLFSDDVDYNKPNQPVTGVTRFDAEDYCVWAGKRLPTEQEWEKAARGTDGRLYPWGNEEDLSRARLNAAAPVAVTDQPGDVSPYGAVGMAGNVSEWVDELFVGGPSCQNPDGVIKSTVSSSSELRFKAYIRGNNIQGLPHMTKLAHHLWDYPDTVAEFVGFRCARNEKNKNATFP